MTTIEQRVRDIIVFELGVGPDKVTREANIFDDLGADSLDAIELVFAVECEFDIEIPDETVVQLQTVGDIIDYLEARL